MRWIAMLVVCFCTVWAFGCSNWGEDWTAPGDDGSTTTITTDPPQPLTCNGLCVDTPPATYTGPSLFWLGLFDAAPDCPPETPFQGLQGLLTNPTPTWQFARECRITPSDLCQDEGKTCAPNPGIDYRVCIHHDDDSPCTIEYPDRSAITEVESDMPVTLCCKPLLISG